jgi:hypothetical protein
MDVPTSSIPAVQPVPKPRLESSENAGEGWREPGEWETAPPNDTGYHIDGSKSCVLRLWYIIHTTSQFTRLSSSMRTELI